MPLLRLEDVEVAYGDMVAVRAISLGVEAGEFVALVGSNGAGKTTTLRAITGLLRPRRGVIELDGRRIDGLAPAAVVAHGIAHVPEGRQLFPTMTVLENITLGARTPRSRRQRPETLRRIFELFPRLEERAGQLAGTLSGGEQQMCSIARALMSCPSLLLLDEPSLGLSPMMVRTIFENLKSINRSGTTILLVEQNVRRALELSDRAYVLENGRVVLDGPRDRLLQSGHIKQAYLGL
jgi:branched-chain amino acid transport system ATP-binding protein